MIRGLRRAPLFLLVVLSSQAFAASRPPDAGPYLELGVGEYLTAPDNFSLDGALRADFAIEFWIKAESVPRVPNQQRVVVAKPGAYAVVIRSMAEMANIGGFPLPLQWPSLEVIGFGEVAWSNILMIVEPGVWHHVAYRTWRDAGERHEVTYIDGKRAGWGQGTQGLEWGTNTNSRFYVGDIPRDAIKGIEGFAYDPLASGRLALDELKIMKKIPGSAPDLRVRPDADETTVALWHFDEGPGAVIYRDSSRFGNDLRRDTLAVSPKGVAAVTWAELRAGL